MILINKILSFENLSVIKQVIETNFPVSSDMLCLSFCHTDDTFTFCHKNESFILFSENSFESPLCQIFVKTDFPVSLYILALERKVKAL